MKTGAELIAEERARHEGLAWTADHDDEHDDESLAWAATCYSAPKPIQAEVWIPAGCGCREAACPHESPFNTGWRDPWPWGQDEDARPGKGSRVRLLVKAGALLCAEIDRLGRLP